MSSFTISQTPESINLYLYPDGFKPGTDTSGFIPSTGTNYECIDDTYNNHNEDTDYVYTISNTNINDLYTLPDHTTETGNINYVKVLTRSRCTYSAQVSGSSYKILMDVSGVTSVSAQKYPVTSSYADYTYTETSTPSGAGWTWDAIDNLCIGIEGNSQNYAGTVDKVLGVASGTTLCQFSEWGCDSALGQGSDCLNQTSDDDYLMHNITSGHSSAQGLFPVESTSLSGFTINKVTFFYRTKCNNPPLDTWDSTFKMFRSDATWNGDTVDTTYAFQTHSYETTTWDGNPWIWDYLEDLNVGVYWQDSGHFGTPLLTRLYTVVNYTVNQGNELRTTQCYAMVNYTPSTATVTLNMPSSLQVSHSRNVGRHTFPSGSYEVDDYGRSGKTLTLSGQETSDASDTMQSVKDMVHYGAVITVAGLDDSNLNTSYHIVDFSFSQEAGMFNRYMWTLSLEED